VTVKSVRAWVGLVALGAAIGVVPACKEEERPRSGFSGSGRGGANSSGGSRSAQGGDDSEGSAGAPGGAGEASETGGQGSAGEPGGGSGGTTSGGTAGTGGTLGEGGVGESPFPPEGEPPLCVHDAVWGTPVLVATVSGAGDDLLMGLTPDELSIVWKRGDTYYVADRSDVTEPFGAPLEVEGGSVFSAVTLKASGLELIAIQGLSVVELVRAPGEAFDAADAEPGDFESFDLTLASVPVPNRVLRDAVVSADDASFFYSFFTEGKEGAYASLWESRRSGGQFSFAGLDLGKVLYANDDAFRIPTGISSDRLTLFYRDEVEGDFRAAWRVNTEVKFDYTEVITVGEGVRSVAPNGLCDRLYFSAEGENDVDIFRVDRVEE
jgi:hypothetical protein